VRQVGSLAKVKYILVQYVVLRDCNSTWIFNMRHEQWNYKAFIC